LADHVSQVGNRIEWRAPTRLAGILPIALGISRLGHNKNGNVTNIEPPLHKHGTNLMKTKGG